jgi:hypothetical protein
MCGLVEPYRDHDRTEGQISPLPAFGGSPLFGGRNASIDSPPVSDLLALLETPFFRSGLRLGIVALGTGWALRFVVGRYRPPLPIFGLFLTVVTVAGLYLTAEPLGPMVPALGIIVVAVLIVRLLKAPRWAQPIAALPGAVWLAFWAPVTEFLWVRILMALLVPIAGFLIGEFERRHDRMGLGVIFFTLAVLGMFAAVPDTEQALIISAAAATLTLLAWPKVAASVGVEGAYAAVAIFLWVAAAGGVSRPPSIVGSAACLGFLLLEPLIVALRPKVMQLISGMRRNWLGAVLASIPQFVLVVICSRIAARFSVMLPAVLIIAAAYALAVGAGLYIASRAPERAEAAPSPY